MSLLAAVEALGRVDAVTRKVTDAAARVARLGAAEAAGTALLEAALVYRREAEVSSEHVKPRGRRQKAEKEKREKRKEENEKKRTTATLLALRAHARDVTRLAATVADTGTGAATRGKAPRREATGRGTAARVLGALARLISRVGGKRVVVSMRGVR